jgi:hypothetical protein
MRRLGIHGLRIRAGASRSDVDLGQCMSAWVRPEFRPAQSHLCCLLPCRWSSTARPQERPVHGVDQRKAAANAAIAETYDAKTGGRLHQKYGHDRKGQMSSRHRKDHGDLSIKGLISLAPQLNVLGSASRRVGPMFEKSLQDRELFVPWQEMPRLWRANRRQGRPGESLALLSNFRMTAGLVPPTMPARTKACRAATACE